VHKAFHAGLLCLRQQHPRRRGDAYLPTCLSAAGVSYGVAYDSPAADELGFVQTRAPSRLARAA
jgi:hypothetical protein